MKRLKVSEHAFELRPASVEEAGLFYSDEEKDKALGTVGHLRMDFGSGGNGFHHSWWPHNDDRFNTSEFKESLQEFVDAMRQNGPLKSLAAMNTYCWHNGGEIAENDRVYGFIAETEHYKFCLRCTPRPGDYQGYLYCYDLRQQEMSQQDKIVGRVSYADGTKQEFADSQQYLKTIKEELPFQNTTGFRYETLTDDPEIRKAVDDILLDFAGEENPRRACNYGLTEKGLQALRDVADPSLPHTYAWFVMTDCNTPQEELHRGLTLNEAIQLFQDSDRPEKRLGVTKDAFATVDIVRMPMYFKNCFNPKKETLEIPRSSLHRANLLDAEELLLHTGGGYIMVTRNALDTCECLHLLQFLTSIATSLLFQLVVNSHQDEEFDGDEWDEDYEDMPDGDASNADYQEDSEISIPDWMLKQAGLSTEHGLEISVEDGKVTISAANQVQKGKEASCGGCDDPLACFDDGFLRFLLMAGVDLERLEQQMCQEAEDHA